MLPRVFTVTTVLIFVSLCAFAGGLSTDEISAIQEKAKKDAAGMALPPNDYEAPREAEGGRSLSGLSIRGIPTKIALERERIRKEVFGREGHITRTAKRTAPREGSEPTSGFTSFSPRQYPRGPFAVTRARLAPWATAT